MEISDSSSQLGDFEFLADSSSSIDSLSPELELLSQEICSKGPQKSELEMRYDVVTSMHYENLPMQYTVIFSTVKNDILLLKFFDICLIFAQNIDCGYK